MPTRSLATLSCLLALVGCSGNSALVGRWRSSKGDVKQFFKDGTSNFTFKETYVTQSVAGKWDSISGDAVKVTANMGLFGEKTITAKWKVEGDTLTWQEGDNSAETYERQDQ